MFIIGSKFVPGLYSVIEVTQKTARKHYHINEINVIPLVDQPGTSVDARTSHADMVTGLYFDKKYFTVKKVFSQDRRPAKRMTAHPRIVIFSENSEMSELELIRGQNTPVEAVVLNPEQPGTIEANAGLGADHHVAGDELVSSFNKAASQKRIIINCSLPESTKSKIENAAAQIEDIGDKHLSLLIPAVWFRETVKFKSSYVTGSNRLRRQI